MLVNIDLGKKQRTLLVLAFAALLLGATLFQSSGAYAQEAKAGEGVAGETLVPAEGSNLMTRDELAKRVANAAGFEEDPGQQIFEDVPPSHRYYRYVNRLANRGILGGFLCGTRPGEPCVPPANMPYFRPDVATNRSQVAKVVSLAAGFNETVTGQTFQDVSPFSSPYVFVERLASRNIMGGFACSATANEPCVAPENRPYFRPFGTITNPEVSQILARAFPGAGGSKDVGDGNGKDK